MITGGVAAIVYGEPRLTQDVDVVAAMKPEIASVFATKFPPAEYYCPPAGAIAEEAGRSAFGHFNLLHLESGSRADVYLAGTDSLAHHGLAHRRMVTLAGLEVPLAPPDYVILHKLRFRQQGGSERHLRDIRGMLRVLGNSVDVEALRDAALKLGLQAPWEEMEALRD